jgi:hypothetical protein
MSEPAAPLALPSKCPEFPHAGAMPGTASKKPILRSATPIL